MTVRVKFFASAREKAGTDEQRLELPSGATVGQMREELRSQFPSIANVLETCAFAVNQKYATPATQLRDGDELAILPPVSGG